MQAKVYVSLEVSRSPSRHVLSSCFGITSPRLVACLWAALSHFRSFERTPNAIRHVCVYQCSFSIHRAMLILENFKPMDERERNFNGTQNNNTVPVSFELCQRHNSHDRTMFIYSHTPNTFFPHHIFSVFYLFLATAVGAHHNNLLPKTRNSINAVLNHVFSSSFCIELWQIAIYFGRFFMYWIL